MKDWRRTIVICLIACCGWSCAAVNQLNLLTPQDEVEIGKQASREVEESLSMYGDAVVVVVAYVDSLGQALVRASALTQFQYHFKVVDAPEVNAFALPGGFLYVNRGLIEAAATESELVGVIGHEIGHVVGHHGARATTEASTAAAVKGALRCMGVFWGKALDFRSFFLMVFLGALSFV